ncbi:granulocyte-macrophage colony-stimulating factor receptor subunit alpha-like [Sturnira hondurensis]|uniref:granulocyte-macrophage colony-stimulating factor receptor subunit alpha-like n=1 Tax=Sturnira hondurensis TaxID=192404 RepID=UPI00187AE6BB|nr:granulocyte-macrophage colony-stimulating factor receptor subunit alpha-like [Sturnira hondurensis]
MAFVLGFASLLVVPLTSARCADPLPAEENAFPIRNMELDPWTKTLTWTSQGTVTEQQCQIDTPPHSSTRGSPEPGDQDAYFCHFPNAVLHRGATLTVNGTADGAPFRCALHFHNPGREGSGAVNFSCVISNVQFLDCSWAPGPAAPGDVQYQLYCWACRDDDQVECPRYILDDTGTQVGCHFGALPEAQPTDTYRFLLNGASRETGIQFVDFPPMKAIKMEKLNPPANLTVDFNGSHHVLHWDNPKMRFDLSWSSLCYEVDIQVAGTHPDVDATQGGRWGCETQTCRGPLTSLPSGPETGHTGCGGDRGGRVWVEEGTSAATQGATVPLPLLPPPHLGPSPPPAGRHSPALLWKVSQRGQERNVYAVPGVAVRGRHAVRLRARTVPSALWSEWSPTLRFGHPEPEVSGTSLALVGLLVGAVVLVISILTVLCTRWPLRRTLFPPVPQVKTELVDSFATSPVITWDGGHRPPSMQEAEDIVAVEEMLPCVSGPAEPTDPADPAPPQLRKHPL